MFKIILSFFSIGFVIMTTGCAKADIDTIMDEYLWTKRPVFIFTPSQTDQNFQDQQQNFVSTEESFRERDIVIWHIVKNTYVSVDGEVKPHLFADPFHNHFDIDPNQFSILLIGKDGNVKLQSSTPISLEKLLSTIDAMPMRQREMKNSSK